jgi:hypothetical protein
MHEDRKLGVYDISRHVLTEGPTQLFVNGGNANHYLRIALHAYRGESDTTLIGTIVTVRVHAGVELTRTYTGGVHGYSQNERGVLHFGLGEFDTALLFVQWPTDDGNDNHDRDGAAGAGAGKAQVHAFGRVQANQLVYVYRGNGKIRLGGGNASKT